MLERGVNCSCFLNMDHFFFFVLSVTLPLTFSSSAGADEVTNITATKGEDCKLQYSKTITLKLSVLEWSRSDQNKRLLVFRGALQEGYEDPLYTNRVELLDPQLQTNLSVVLKNVTEKDTGTYRCKAVYEDGQKMFQFIHLTVTERETTKAEARTEIETRTNTEIETRTNTEIETRTNTEIKTETNTEIETRTNTEIETETHTEPSLGLILGLVIGPCALILVIIALWVLFQKRIKDKPFFSNKSSCFQKLKKLFTTCLNDSSSSSASSTPSNGSDEPLIKPPPPSRDTEQNTPKPSVFSGSCPPSSPPPGTPSLGGGNDLSALPL